MIMINTLKHQILFFSIFFYGSLVLHVPAFSQVELVYDINPSSNHSWGPELMTVFNGKLYFRTSDGISGEELWEYDGINPPSLVADIMPGPQGISAFWLKVFQGKLYFSARDGVHGAELWAYDGVNPPAMVYDIRPGSASGLLGEVTEYNNKLYFRASDGIHGDELWEYDGVNPPGMVYDLYPGTPGITPLALRVFNNKLYFVAFDTTTINVRRPYTYDGVNPPTIDSVLGVLGLNNATGRNDNIVVNNKFYSGGLLYSGNTTGVELWEYDGVNPPNLIMDIWPGSNSSRPLDFEVLGNDVIFRANDGTNGNEIWKYDGVNPPFMIQNLNPGGLIFPDYLTVVYGKLYYSHSDGIHGIEPWVYDGVNPPSMIQDIRVGPGHSGARGFVGYNGKLYFAARDAAHGQELRVLCPKDTLIKTVNTCAAYIWPVNGQTYTSSGIYSEQILNTNGCDSVKILDLTITGTNTTLEVVNECDSFYWPVTDRFYTSSGLYLDSTTSGGCDSVAVLELTIGSTHFQTPAVTACDSFVSFSGNSVWRNSGVYMDTLPTMLGCDSVFQIDLTINSSDISMTQTIQQCDSFFWASNGITYFTGGQYTEILQNNKGCDSLVSLDLTINQSTSDSQSVHACDSFFWAETNQYYYASGQYQNLLSSSEGCDSILELDLDISPSYFLSQSLSSCDSFVAPGSLKVWTNSGIYLDTFLTTSGCDSVFQYDLTVHYADSSTESVQSCDSFTWSTNNTTYYSSGQYSGLLTTQSGCDSLVHLSLDILSSDELSIFDTICQGDQYFFGNQTYTNSGTIQKHFVNNQGCDSSVTLNLHVKPVNIQVAYQAPVLISFSANGQLEWLNCDSAFAPVGNESDQVFLPPYSGSYAVRVSQDGCVDTSDCVSVMVSGLNNVAFDEFHIVPNPAQDYVILQIPESQIGSEIQLSLLDAQGKTVQVNQLEKRADELKIDLAGMAPGSYQLVIRSQSYFQVIRLVKK